MTSRYLAGPIYLAGALVQVVEKARPRRVWIEAVWIDQSNLQVRGIQIGMMASIYQYTQSVYVYFGQEDAASEFIIRPGLAGRLPLNQGKTAAVRLPGSKLTF